jgi:hypothetical protein
MLVGIGSGRDATGWSVAAIAGEAGSAWDLCGGVGYGFDVEPSVPVAAYACRFRPARLGPGPSEPERNANETLTLPFAL